MEQLNAERVELDREQAERLNADDEEVAAWTDADFARCQQLKRGEIRLLQREVELRRDLASLADDYQGVLRELSHQAYADLEAAESDVKKKLVKMGYHDPAVVGQNGSYTPQPKSGSGDYAKENSAALQKTLQRMASIRDRLVSA